MAIIIAAHAGTGKSYAAKTNSSLFIDLTYFKYRYDIPDDYIHNENKDSESLKANFGFPDNKDYPENYLEAIKAAAKENKILFIVPEPRILSWLELEDIPYAVAYPIRSAKEEYRRRFLARGNEENFMDIFIGRWDRFIDEFERNTYARHIILESCQYLTDVIDESFLSKNIDEIGIKSTLKIFTQDDAEKLMDELTEHIAIPSGYDEIGESAFAWLNDIKTVTVPEGVKYIADGAFEGSLYITVLEKVTLPDSLKVIDMNAFSRNEALSDISFGKGLREIRTFAFAGCKGLKSITLPDNLKTIETGAFFGCKGLENGGVSFRGKTYKLEIKDDYCDMSEEFYAAVNERNNDL